MSIFIESEACYMPILNFVLCLQQLFKLFYVHHLSFCSILRIIYHSIVVLNSLSFVLCVLQWEQVCISRRQSDVHRGERIDRLTAPGSETMARVCVCVETTWRDIVHRHGAQLFHVHNPFHRQADLWRQSLDDQSAARRHGFNHASVAVRRQRDSWISLFNTFIVTAVFIRVSPLFVSSNLTL